MTNVIRKVVSLFMLLCLVATISFATKASTVLQTATLWASIVDSDGRGVPDVSVLITGGSRTWRSQSDHSGKFKVDLPLGSYTVRLEKAGYENTEATDLVMKQGVFSINIEMGVGILSETIADTFGGTVTEIQPELQPINFSPLSRPVPAPQSAPNIAITGNLTPNTLKRGRLAQGTITMDIPAGYHVNSNRPLEEFLVATKLTVDAPQEIRVGPIVYPRALLRTFKFSKNKLSVYEGKVVLRFSVTVPASVGAGAVELKAHLRYQSCNDSLCFPPKSQDVNLSLTIN
jgi:hypothetical protein